MALAAIVTTSQQAASASTPPPAATPWSYYDVDDNTNTAQTLGCNQGIADYYHGLDSTVFLDFFGQNSALTGTLMDFGNDIFISNAQIESIG